ncbi:Periplasmic protein-like protein [Sulfitobacter noctilucicola]|uniref:Periplasmic protein-like protein n=1 Tax=Sulfitobacter noctilucicola TaxID=1342301 RepID=A0A7W6Q547_9RHOB|nr:hypothetical protein [Sulfitobacter noctilucicola]KIN64002.1 Periplasmic protein-like protein [Sulfitobacter noctilucicola]MBB4175358.1 hypothetical protein [Sulfitobacter noctilucicola]
MSTAENVKPRNPIARVLGGILFFQILLGGLLFWGDLRNGLSLPGFGPRAPSLTEPIRPGDQTRRYREDRAPSPGQPMPDTALPDRLVLTVVEAGQTVLLEGSIAGGDGARIAKDIAALPQQPQRIILNSPGGSVSDALELGRFIRAEGIETRMREGDICYSACPYVLAAGTVRDIPEGGSVGVHQHYFGQSTLLPAFVAVEDIQRGQGEVMGYLDDMGIDPLVMRHALITPPDEIYVLVPAELREYGFITEPQES